MENQPPGTVFLPECRGGLPPLDHVLICRLVALFSREQLPETEQLVVRGNRVTVQRVLNVRLESGVKAAGWEVSQVSRIPSDSVVSDEEFIETQNLRTLSACVVSWFDGTQVGSWTSYVRMGVRLLQPRLTTFLGTKDIQVGETSYDIALDLFDNKDFQAWLRQAHIRGKNLALGGFSLGGAVSGIMGLLVSQMEGIDVTVVGFGSPRIGNQRFVELAINRLGANSAFYVVCRDVDRTETPLFDVCFPLYAKRSILCQTPSNEPVKMPWSCVLSDPIVIENWEVNGWAGQEPFAKVLYRGVWHRPTGWDLDNWRKQRFGLQEQKSPEQRRFLQHLSASWRRMTSVLNNFIKNGSPFSEAFRTAFNDLHSVLTYYQALTEPV